MVQSMHARVRKCIVHYCTCPPDGFCIARDTIAYAKVTGADSIALRTQLHLTPTLAAERMRCFDALSNGVYE